MKYSKDQINDMIERLAESEFEGLTDGDFINILIEGCTGYNNMADDEVIELFEDVFGDDQYEEEV